MEDRMPTTHGSSEPVARRTRQQRATQNANHRKHYNSSMREQTTRRHLDRDRQNQHRDQLLQLQNQLTRYQLEIQALQQTNTTLSNDLNTAKDRIFALESALRSTQIDSNQPNEVNPLVELLEEEERCHELTGLLPREIKHMLFQGSSKLSQIQLEGREQMDHHRLQYITFGDMEQLIVFFNMASPLPHPLSPFIHCINIRKDGPSRNHTNDNGGE